MFAPDDEPTRCVQCPHAATWKVYNKRLKADQYYCDKHVPPEGTPRITKRERFNQGRYLIGHPGDSFLEPVALVPMGYLDLLTQHTGPERP